MKRSFSSSWLVITVVVIALLLPFGKAFGDMSGKVIVFNAGSLTIPLAEMEKRFEAKYFKLR